MSTVKSDHPDSHQSIIRSTSMISLGTLASRILGFIRDVILAKLLGTGFRADAFFVALKIPNLFRDLVGEGATNAAVVPIFSEYKEKKSKEEFLQFVSVVFALSLIVLSLITILGIFFAPSIVRILVPGFIAYPEKLALTIRLTRLVFPYLIFIGLTAYAMAVLYTFRSFMVPAISPCLFNIAIILGAIFISPLMPDPVFGLAIGVLIGGVLQLLAHIPPILKQGVRFYKPKSLLHPGAKKIGRLLIPRIIGSSVYQLTVLVDNFCASLSFIVGAGGVSAIYYSNRIIQFPMGIFSLALASVVLPTFSGFAQRNDIASIKRTLVFALENIFFVMCPTTIALMILSTPIIQILFERGAFGWESTQVTASALLFFSIGLFSFGGIKILVTVFHSLQDTKTPVKVAAFCLMINALLNFILMYPLKVGGIALASSIAGTADFLILLTILKRKLGGLNSDLLQYFLKVTLASSIIGLFEFVSWQFVHIPNQAVKLVLIGILGIIFYQAVCLFFCVEQAQKIQQWILRKK